MIIKASFKNSDNRLRLLKVFKYAPEFTYFIKLFFPEGSLLIKVKNDTGLIKEVEKEGFLYRIEKPRIDSLLFFLGKVSFNDFLDFIDTKKTSKIKSPSNFEELTIELDYTKRELDYYQTISKQDFDKIIVKKG